VPLKSFNSSGILGVQFNFKTLLVEIN